MCGLFGCMGPGITHRDLTALKHLGTVSQVRGYDGSGIYQVKSNDWSYNGRSSFNYERFYKGYETFSELLQYVEDKTASGKNHDIMNDVMVDVIIGHVRWATKGVINDSNSHPFMFSNLVGAHNGTLKDKKYEHKDKTDSEMMFADISHRGLVPVLSELDRDSAYAITMYDRVDKKMIFVRNELREFSFAFLEDRAVVFWASEKSMLKYVLGERLGIKARYFGLTPGKVVSLKASDITMTGNKEDPLKALKAFTLENRPIPTEVEKAMKARAEWEAKQKAEEEKKREESEKVKELTSSTSISQTGWTETVVPSTGKVLEFKPQKTSVPIIISSAYKKCSCSKVTLNPVQADQARRGTNHSVIHDHVTDTYHCEDCVKVEKKVVH